MNADTPHFKVGDIIRSRAYHTTLLITGIVGWDPVVKVINCGEISHWKRYPGPELFDCIDWRLWEVMPGKFMQFKSLYEKLL